MSLDADKLLADLKDLAEPKLRETAAKVKGNFLTAFKDYLDAGTVHKFDTMMEDVADLQIKAVTAKDRNIASQYASAADAKMRQISILLVAEKIVASQEIGNLIESAAVTVWGGFKEVAVGLVGAVIKGALSGLLGPVGGAIAGAAGGVVADAAETFLGGDQPTEA